MDHRIMEICYDLNTIPGRTADASQDPRVIRFRDIAVARIDQALAPDGLGYCVGAEVEYDRLRLRFVVQDFDAAEIRLDSELDGTAWNQPVEMLRYWDAAAAA